MAADVVRALEFAAIAALTEGFHLQRIVRATHAATGRRYFSLGDSHGGTISSNKYICCRRRHCAGEGVILEGRPYGKDGARTSGEQVRAFLGQQRREGARYTGKIARCKVPRRALATQANQEGIST
jgi:hypothetical protein